MNMMNKFKKYCPNVWVVETPKHEEYDKGDIIEVETKYGKIVECEAFNLVASNDSYNYYSVVRLDESYAQRKAERYRDSATNHQVKSEQRFNAANEGREFLSLGEPIKVGHHSEKRHRALIERNNSRMQKGLEYAKKAEQAESKADYWEKKADEITLANPESLEYFKHKLEKAVVYHKGLKDGTFPKEHSYSVTYAKKDVNELSKKVDIAEKLWGEVHEV